MHDTQKELLVVPAFGADLGVHVGGAVTAADARHYDERLGRFLTDYCLVSPFTET